MSGKPAPQTVSHKPCLCRIFPNAQWLWRPTHRVNAQRQAEFKCRLCGVTTYRQGETSHPASGLGAD